MIGREAGWHAQHPRFPSGKLLRGSPAAPAPARITAETLDLTYGWVGMGEDGICSTLDGKQAALPQWLGLAVLCRVINFSECAGPLCEHNLIHLLRLSIAGPLPIRYTSIALV